MVPQLRSSQPEVIYPDSDGQPMSDNTKQFRWIVVIQQNLDWLFADDPNVFVAGDLLWYPVEGDNKTRIGPDVMVALGRPKGDRGSYKQWQEANMPPQVVFEILSPSNTRPEMAKKLGFYDRFGVEEYYEYDPDTDRLKGWQRVNQALQAISPIENWVSPRLGIRFNQSDAELQIYRPDGQPFFSYAETSRQVIQAQAALDEERERANQEQQRANQEQQRADRLAAQLRSLGIDPEQL